MAVPPATPNGDAEPTKSSSISREQKVLGDESKPASNNGESGFDAEGQVGEFKKDNSFLSTSRRWINKIGAEESGIERIPEEWRKKQSPWSLFNVFFSANCCTPTLALGYLGPASFGLGWWDSFLCILFFNVIGASVPALIALYGHRTGLRTMTVPRYSFGWWPSKALAIINIIIQIGWAIVNDLAGANLLYNVGGGKLPSAVCVVILGVVSIIIGILGYKFIHAYEKYSWIIIFVCFVILAGFGGRDFVNVPMGTGPVEAASVLSFSTVIIGFQVAWAPIAADYTVYMPETTSNWAVFGCAFSGLFLSQFFFELLGAAVGTLVLSPDARFGNAYDAGGIGGLIGEIFSTRGSAIYGLGKFVEVMLAFSAIAVVVIEIYSIGLSVQMVTQKAIRVPRLVWSLLGGAVFLVCAVAGRDHLETVMTNFLNMCAYYLVPLTMVMLLEEHVWRRGFAYDLEAWNKKDQLPIGIAATAALISGTVISLLCMSQVWWVGPIAKAIGGSPTGTDISWMLGAVVTTIVYIPARYFELKKWNR